MINSSQEQYPFDETENFMSNEISFSETFSSCSKEHKSGWRRPILGKNSKNIQITKKTSKVSWNTSPVQQSSQHLKNNMSPYVDFPNSDTLTVCNSWKRRKHDNPENIQNERVLKADNF